MIGNGRFALKSECPCGFGAEDRHCECFREPFVRRLPPVGRGVTYTKYIVLRVLVQEYSVESSVVPT